MKILITLINPFVFAGITVLSVIALLFSHGYSTTIKERNEKDSERKVWILKDWEEGARPYPRNLKEREAWYRKKWGEDWNGPVNNCRIHSPGNWRWDIVTVVPPDMANRIKGSADLIWKNTRWGSRYNIMNFVWAPGGGDVTDIYVLSDYAFYHYDPVSKKSMFIGKPEEGGLVDGEMEEARLYPTGEVTLDYVTGRIYFTQSKLNRSKTSRIEKKFRYIEKLLPYKCSATNKTYLFPAVLDWNNLYSKVKIFSCGNLQPVFNNGIRGEPVFTVKTSPAVKNKKGIMSLGLPGTNRGKRPLITPDGKEIWLSQVGRGGVRWDTKSLYETTALFNIETGEMEGKLRLNGIVPPNNWNGTKRWAPDGPGTHGGNNVGYEGMIYTAQHGGCCGSCGSGPGRMFSINPKTGKVTTLYDSMDEDGTWRKNKSRVIDGPADAKSLRFTSTLYQIQCPRTGAIINGGWDNSGIRRYHDGFVTTIINGDERYRILPRPEAAWDVKGAPRFYHRNSNPAIAPNGDLYIADIAQKWGRRIIYEGPPRVIRIYRTDWPPEQPVNGYAEKFMSKDELEYLMLEYAKKHISITLKDINEKNNN